MGFYQTLGQQKCVKWARACERDLSFGSGDQMMHFVRSQSNQPPGWPFGSQSPEIAHGDHCLERSLAETGVLLPHRQNPLFHTHSFQQTEYYFKITGMFYREAVGSPQSFSSRARNIYC